MPKTIKTDDNYYVKGWKDHDAAMSTWLEGEVPTAEEIEKELKNWESSWVMGREHSDAEKTQWRGSWMKVNL